MKTVCKKLLCLMLVAMMLVSAVPFAFAAEGDTHKIVYQLKLGTSNDVADSFEFTYVEGDPMYASAMAAYKFGISQSEITAVWYEATDEKIEGTAAQNASFTCVDEGRIVVRANGEGSDNQGSDNQGSDNQGSDNQGSDNQGSDNQGTVTPTYGTLYVTVYTYNANSEAKEAGTLNFNSKASYKLNNALAEECFEEFGIVNVEEYHWQSSDGSTVDLTDGKDHYANLVADPIRTPGNRKIVTLTINHNRGNGNDDRQTVETLAGTKILDVLAYAEEHDYFDEPTRKGYRLAGYSFDMNCSDDVNRDDVINADMTIYCEWEKTYVANKYDVTLRVYTNGDTQYVDKVFDLEDYAGDGKITRTEVENLLDKKYSAKSGYSLAYYGLFTAETWDDGDYDTDDAVSTIKVNDYGKTVIYVMVKNVKKAVADSSNPKTGDNIMIAVSTMALAGAALVTMVELKKRKMI